MLMFQDVRVSACECQCFRMDGRMYLCGVCLYECICVRTFVRFCILYVGYVCMSMCVLECVSEYALLCVYVCVYVLGS